MSVLPRFDEFYWAFIGLLGDSLSALRYQKKLKHTPYFTLLGYLTCACISAINSL